MYEDIIKIEPKIRLVTICDSKGRVTYSEHHEGVKNATTEESKESQEVSLSSQNTRIKLAPKNRKGKYVLAEYGKI